MSNNENNKPKPSAALAAAEKFLGYLANKIQKLENMPKDDASMRHISEIEQQLIFWWKEIMRFNENELAKNINETSKNEQKMVFLEHQYANGLLNSINTCLDKLALLKNMPNKHNDK